MRILYLWLLVLYLAMSALALPSSTLSYRIDNTGGGQTKQSIFVVLSVDDNQTWELWASGINTDTITGKLGYFESGKVLRFGGYLIANAKEIAIDPTISANFKTGNGKAYTCLDYKACFSNEDNCLSGEVRVLWPTKWEYLEAGPVIYGSAYEGDSMKVHYGVATKVTLIRAIPLYIRYCPWGDGPDTIRAQVTFGG